MKTYPCVSRLTDLFFKHSDDISEDGEPVATLFAVADIVNEFLSEDAPVLDGSEPIGEETVDEYLHRLVKKASPAWQGVDKEKFLAEVRGRVPFDEAIDLLRQLADLQNGPPLETYREEWAETMSAVYEFIKKHEQQ